MCETLCNSVIFPFAATIRGPSNNCNPPCCQNICNGGFNDDDPRFAMTRPQNSTSTTSEQPRMKEPLPSYPASVTVNPLSESEDGGGNKL